MRCRNCGQNIVLVDRGWRHQTPPGHPAYWLSCTLGNVSLHAEPCLTDIVAELQQIETDLS